MKRGWCLILLLGGCLFLSACGQTQQAEKPGDKPTDTPTVQPSKVQPSKVQPVPSDVLPAQEEPRGAVSALRRALIGGVQKTVTEGGEEGPSELDKNGS